MKRILLLMWVLLLGISMQAQTTITVTSENTLASQLASLSTIQSTLIINGELTSEDFGALNSATYPQLASVTKLDLSGATVASISDMTDMNLSAMEYLRLPDGMTSADDVAAMANLHTSSKNAALKMAGALSNTLTYDGVTTDNKEVAIYSFVPNSAGKFKTAFPILEGAKSVRMAGSLGDNDLIDHSNNNTPIFGWNGPVGLWDFTGASFTDCTIPSYTFQYQTESGDKRHFDLDDPFKETEGFTSLPDNYQTNSFYYFKDLATEVVDIKLPTGIESLPPQSLLRLGSQNKANYMAVHNMNNDDFAAAFSYVENNQTKVPDYAPIETLVIPNSYEVLDHECALEARIKNLYIGNGVKEIRGGAFVHCETLENLDFAAGISDCYIGNLAFGECKSMKHIALAEGIVSLGANAFSNSQHLESIRLPESLIYIGNEAFNNCLALNSITIPSNVEKIGQNAFTLCPFTDIYLTTTDPDKIPLMWSAGLYGDNSGGSFDGRASFNHGHFDGWEGFSDNFGDYVNSMTWDEAAEWYYVHVNGLPVLHYPQQLADKVKAIISSNYHGQSTDGYRLPVNRVDMSSRSADQIMDNYSDVTDLVDAEGKGQYTQNGWTQFVLMKEYVPGEEDVVYSKEYSDVWYTMCFPFDLTDEQLAAAFNETFNIVDFSGIELKAKTDTDPMKMILHFNKVAVTYYKDVNEKVYHRLCEGGTSLNDIYWGEEDQTLWREQHDNFKYNVYIDDEGNIYHHVHPKGGQLNKNKTKTFAISTAAGQGNADNAIIIDGILAEAGHPYMIHPAIGVNPGQPKKACNMAGITWRPEASRAQLYEDRKRTIDLGVESTRDKNRVNYYQAGYTNLGGKDYTGQEYTFIGNSKDYKDGWQDDTSLPTRPTDESLVEPKAPQNPNPKPKAPKKKLSAPEQVTNPDDKAKYADVKELFKTVRLTFSGWNGSANVENVPYTYGEDLANYEMSEFFTNWGTYAYATRSSAHNYDINNSDGLNAFKTYLGGEPIPSNIESRFAALKSLAEDYQSELDAFNDYDVLYEQYLANKALWDAYDAAMTEWNSWVAPADEQAAYNTAYAAWQTAVDNYNTWKTAMGNKGYNVVIPQYAYFLGTKTGEIYPKYFRERSNDQNRSTGLWTQYTAIIMPNDKAIAGVEKDLDAKTQVASGSKIAFNEPFFFIDDTPQGIATLIEKIEKEEGKAPNVEYMDIVVSIDGKIISRDKTTFEGLPKGVYIINGKKYYVK